jgi:tetraacyldisaccharide 4'-kinase
VAINRRNRRFDRGKGVVTFDRPVISVGNLSVGGTGKTPMVHHLLTVLLAAGHRPCIAMRGYMSKGGAGGESDEAQTYRRAFPDVPVIAQPDRVHGLIRRFHEEYNSDAAHTDCILLDDGFQHRRIARQMDIVLIDATRPPFGDRLLPAGWLREPIASLKRATHTIITHAESVAPAQRTSLERSIEEARGHPPIAVTRHYWSTLEPRAGAANGPRPLASIRGQRILAVCAIGNPGPFLASAQHFTGQPLAGHLVLRDHDEYARETVEKIVALARELRTHAILTTDKDWSKLATVPPETWPCPVLVPKLELAFDRGEADLAAAALETVQRGVPEDE